MVKPFTVRELFGILNDQGYNDGHTLILYYLFTGGMPKYVELLLANEVYSETEIINFIFSHGSPFLEEGKHVLIEEFGKEYGIYFSILELIAAGKTSRGAIESILQKDIGGYLERLDQDYAVVKKIKPVNAKINTKTQKYHIRDLFLRFWFRFIFRNKSLIESENFAYLKAFLQRDFSAYQGKILEAFYHDLLLQSQQYTRVGSYWERDGSNEIDVVAVDDLHKEDAVKYLKN